MLAIILGVAFCIGFPISCSFLSSHLHTMQKNYDTIEEFSAAWENTQWDNRHKSLEWLLNTPITRHTDYPVEKSRIYGLTRSEIIALLGEPDSGDFQFHELQTEPFIRYTIGSIEWNSPLDNAFGGRLDYLTLYFDAEDRLIGISTSG